MGDFDSLLKTKTTKKKGPSNAVNIYRQGKNDFVQPTLEKLQKLNVRDLLYRNYKNKINNDILSLWGMLDIKSFVDAISGNTVNPYFLKTKEIIPIKDLPEYTYLSDEQRILNLLDIKYIKSFELEGISFKNIFLVTFEISDRDNYFRPYVLLLTLNDDNEFVKLGYGYDTNDNGNVELFISSYNYLVYLTPRGTINSPLTGKAVKLKVYDILTSEEVYKLYLNSNKEKEEL